MKQPMTMSEEIFAYGNRAVKWLFGVSDDWYRNLDMVKNNYALGKRHLEAGNYKDAEFRLKFLTWLDPKHSDGHYQLARAQIALNQKSQAAKSLKKCLQLDEKNVAARELLAALLGKKSTAPSQSVAPETDAAVLYAIHKESFPIYWKEKEISDMMLTSGTQAWSAKQADPLGMLMTRSQFEQAEILTLAVVPSARRQKIAEQLLYTAHRALVLQGVKKMFLEVAENNVAALGLYQKLGYVETGRRKGYYKQEDGNTTDALVMSKEIA